MLVGVVALPFPPSRLSVQPPCFREADKFRSVAKLETELSRSEEASIVVLRCAGREFGLLLRHFHAEVLRAAGAPADLARA